MCRAIAAIRRASSSSCWHRALRWRWGDERGRCVEPSETHQLRYGRINDGVRCALSVLYDEVKTIEPPPCSRSAGISALALKER
jgi:hypothetical protein